MRVEGTYDTTRFLQFLSELQITLSDQQMNQFLAFYEMMCEKNKVMNLTGITEYEEVVIKHFIDSLSLVKAIPLTNQKIIDVGCGAGFPGIPLKIAFPEIEITLLDSLNKRIVFIQDVCESLGLTKIEAIHGRAEDFAQNPKYREQYDICVSRAVSNLSSLSELCIPFVKTDGYFIPYKSEKGIEELTEAQNAIKILGGDCKKNVSFELPSKEKRTLFVIKKEKRTAKIFPRKAGMPLKEPLK